MMSPRVREPQCPEAPSWVLFLVRLAGEQVTTTVTLGPATVIDATELDIESKRLPTIGEQNLSAIVKDGNIKLLTSGLVNSDTAANQLGAFDILSIVATSTEHLVLNLVSHDRLLPNDKHYN